MKYLRYREKLERKYYKVDEILSFVKNELGLDPKQTDFIEATEEEILVLSGYLFPIALPHWTRGRDILLSKQSSKKGTKIYEIVFNTTPALAYIVNTAKPGEVNFIIAHVFGHSHIYKNNIFEPKDETIYLRMRYALDRYFDYLKEYGQNRLDELIEFVHALRFIFSFKKLENNIKTPKENELSHVKVNPKYLKYTKIKQATNKVEEIEDDILDFIYKNSPILSDWERDIINVEKDFIEHIYKQARLKYVHEGFATWTHMKTYLHLFEGEDFFDSLFLDINIYPSIDNPYWFGSQILFALEKDGFDIPKLVSEISDDELFYAYFTKDVWERIVRDISFISPEEKKEIIDNYEKIKEKMLSRFYYPSPRIYVDKYNPYNLDNDVWDVFSKTFAEKERKTFPLTLTSDLPLDRGYANQTVEAIAKVWKNDVFVRCRKID